MDIVLTVILITGVVVSMILGLPMRKHLLKETEIKRILLFQMPFYLKDYHSMINNVENIEDRIKYRRYFTIFLISNIGFIVAAIILLLIPGSF